MSNRRCGPCLIGHHGHDPEGACRCGCHCDGEMSEEDRLVSYVFLLSMEGLAVATAHLTHMVTDGGEVDAEVIAPLVELARRRPEVAEIEDFSKNQRGMPS